MINLFDNTNISNDFNFLLNHAGQDVLINNELQKALITKNKFTGQFDDRIINTNVPIKRGDIIHYNNTDWVIYSEIEAITHHKYKAIMRHLTHSLTIESEKRIIVDEDSLGRPIYETIPILLDIDCYMEQNSMVTTQGQIKMVDGDIIVVTSDNEETEDVAIENKFQFNDRTYLVYAIDRTQKGLLRINAEITASND